MLPEVTVIITAKSEHRSRAAWADRAAVRFILSALAGHQRDRGYRDCAFAGTQGTYHSRMARLS